MLLSSKLQKSVLKAKSRQGRRLLNLSDLKPGKLTKVLLTGLVSKRQSSRLTRSARIFRQPIKKIGTHVGPKVINRKRLKPHITPKPDHSKGAL